MPWSTREVAELAGTTLNTVRHYHSIGLLDVPARSANGYKRYEVRHLVRLLQIRRLRDLGVPLAQVGQMGSAGDAPAVALQAIDADLAASIARLQRARAEIAAVLQGSTVAWVPPGFENLASRLSESEQSLVLIYSQLYDENAMSDVRAMLASDPGDADDEFHHLEPDADEADIQRIAERFAPTIAENLGRYPWLRDQRAHVTKHPQTAADAVVEALIALYNPAQREVVARATSIAMERLGRDEEGA